jgi:hypothetical protein
MAASRTSPPMPLIAQPLAKPAPPAPMIVPPR